MRHRISIMVAVALGAVLAVSVFGQLWVLPFEVKSISANFPETEPIAVPAVIWGVVAVACWQAVIVLALQRALRTRNRQFDTTDLSDMRVMVGCLVAFLALVVAAFVGLNLLGFASGPLMIGLVFAGLLAVVVGASLVTYLVTRYPAPDYVRAAQRASVSQ